MTTKIKVGSIINIIYIKDRKYKDAFSSYNVEVLKITDKKLYFLHLGLNCSRLISDFNKNFRIEIISV